MYFCQYLSWRWESERKGKVIAVYHHSQLFQINHDISKSTTSFFIHSAVWVTIEHCIHQVFSHFLITPSLSAYFAICTAVRALALTFHPALSTPSQNNAIHTKFATAFCPSFHHHLSSIIIHWPNYHKTSWSIIYTTIPVTTSPTLSPQPLIH